MAWWHEAYCAGAYGLWLEELTMAETEFGRGGKPLNEARRVEKVFLAKCGCASCPVVGECLEEACTGDSDPFKGHVAGGLTTEERISLRPISNYDVSRRGKEARRDQSVDAGSADPLGLAGAQPVHVR